jgi:ABC-2 type transport system ATP-binding protein
VVGVDGARVSLRVPRAQTSAVAARILAAHAVTDLTIEDAPLEDVIEQAFATTPSAIDPAHRETAP